MSAIREPKLTGGERAGFDEDEGDRSISMVSSSSGAYDAKADAKHYQGLMTLDQIKAKRSRIESGEEFESEAIKAAKAKKVDDILAAREAQVRSPLHYEAPPEHSCDALLSCSRLWSQR